MVSWFTFSNSSSQVSSVRSILNTVVMRQYNCAEELQT